MNQKRILSDMHGCRRSLVGVFAGMMAALVYVVVGVVTCVEASAATVSPAGARVSAGTSTTGGTSRTSRSDVPTSFAERWTWNPLVDGKRVVMDIASDAGHVYTSPFRMTRKDALVLAGIAAGFALIYPFDEDIHDGLLRSLDHPVYEPIHHAGEFFEPIGFQGNTNAPIIGALVLGYIVRVEPVVEIASDILRTNLIAAAPKEGTNRLVGRRGPQRGLGSRSFKFNDGRSLPSGHTLAITSMATILSHHVDHPVFTAAAAGVAGTVMLQRVTSDHHWPSDVYLSAILGWALSRELVRREEARRSGRGMAVGPIATSSGPGLALRFWF